MNVVSIAGKKYNLRQRFLYGDIVRYILHCVPVKRHAPFNSLSDLCFLNDFNLRLCEQYILPVCEHNELSVCEQYIIICTVNPFVYHLKR